MNKVVHFEIPSDDRRRAKTFYSTVFEWEFVDMPMDGDVYTAATTSPVDESYMHKEKGAINGAMTVREEKVKHPVITIDVPSIDEWAGRIEAAGGAMVVPKGEVPGMGFYAYFSDTEGNVLGLWENLEK